MNSQYDDKLFKGANAKTFENARALRKIQTPTEELLWQELRNRQLSGLKFRRQHPLKDFVADFYCSEKNLVIEVDGSVHNKAMAKDYDEGRTNELNALGVRVLRFTNDEVEANITAVLKRIIDFIQNMQTNQQMNSQL